MWKRIYANDLAADFGWDYAIMSDMELYAALEEQGYDWNGVEWASA